MKLTKEIYARIFEVAHQKLIDNGYTDGTHYLNDREIRARAFAEATLDVLESKGYTLTKSSKD